MARSRRLSQQEYYRGVPTAPYDLVKEISVALVIMLAVVVVLAAVLSSPDAPPVTIQSWAKAQPLDLLQTATTEVQGTSFSADYGPPYDTGNGAVQTLGPLEPQVWAGIHQPVDAAEDDVLSPLRLASVGRPALHAALLRFEQAPSGQRTLWLNAYSAALQHLGAAHPVAQRVLSRPAARPGPLRLGAGSAGALRTPEHDDAGAAGGRPRRRPGRAAHANRPLL